MHQIMCWRTRARRKSERVLQWYERTSRPGRTDSGSGERAQTLVRTTDRYTRTLGHEADKRFTKANSIEASAAL